MISLDGNSLTLAQTEKLAKKITILIYGSSYWKQVINLDLLAEKGAIARNDLELFQFVDSPEEGFEFLRDGLTKYHLGPEPKSKSEGERVPEIAKTNP